MVVYSKPSTLLADAKQSHLLSALPQPLPQRGDSLRRPQSGGGIGGNVVWPQLFRSSGVAAGSSGAAQRRWTPIGVAPCPSVRSATVYRSLVSPFLTSHTLPALDHSLQAPSLQRAPRHDPSHASFIFSIYTKRMSKCAHTQHAAKKCKTKAPQT